MRVIKVTDRLLLFAVAGLLTPVLLFAGMMTFASQMDAQARARQEMMLSHGFEVQLAHVAQVAVGQSIWDESAAHLQTVDQSWAQFNVRDFFIQSSGFEFAAVVDAANHLAYADHDGQSAGADVDAFDKAMDPLVAKLRAREKGLDPLADRVRTGRVLTEPTQETSLAKVGDEYYVVIATLVQPDKTPGLLKGPAPLIVVGEEIDGSFLNTLGDEYLTTGLAIAPLAQTSNSERARSVFNDDSGRPLLALEWEPQRPGSELLVRSLPLLVLVVGVLIALAAVFHLRARRATEQLVASERQASHLAYHDSLTGLPNRVLVAERLGHAIEKMRRNERPFAVHCIDLDRFKDVNDTFGHHVGDELIRGVAQLLIATCRQGDTVARLGGDEFAVIQDDCTPQKAADLAERLVAILAQPIELSVGRVYFGCSIGITLVTTSNPHDPAECLREADLALYRAKERGRGRYCFFEPEMDAALQNRRSLQNDLREALGKGELAMVYQPQVNGRNRVTGVEALMRWTHPVRGSISPAIFIPLAEECGLIEQLGWFAMRTAFKDGARWPGIKIGVNVSASQLRLKNFLDNVKLLVDETRIDPTRFEFEITEGLLLSDTAETHAVLNGVRDLGFQLALDDFGTGYSSLSYLKRFPITRIKIDRSFISNLGADDESEDVVSAIVRLARALKMAVVAEGVETDEQRERLASAGCKHIQGFLASRPLAVDLVQAFIDGENGQAVRAA